MIAPGRNPYTWNTWLYRHCNRYQATSKNKKSWSLCIISVIYYRQTGGSVIPTHLLELLMTLQCYLYMIIAQHSFMEIKGWDKNKVYSRESVKIISLHGNVLKRCLLPVNQQGALLPSSVRVIFAIFLDQKYLTYQTRYVMLYSKKYICIFRLRNWAWCCPSETMQSTNMHIGNHPYAPTIYM